MHQVTKRLNRIFESVLGCRIEYLPIEEISLVDWNLKDISEIKEDASTSPRYIVGQTTDSFGFPVRSENILMGLAVVYGFKDSRPQRLMLLAELMAMVLDYSVRATDRTEKLRIIEERMAMLDDKSNVIPLRPARFERVLRVTEVERRSESTGSPLLSSPLLLVATEGYPLNRIAVEIHEISKRWAFVSVDDLPPEVFVSRESLEQLGGLTLFIRDIAKLTTNQQLKLGEYLGRAMTDDSPFVIAGANESIDDLLHAGRILPYLARLFTVSVLNTTSKKSAALITQELVEASLMQIVSGAKSDVLNSHRIGDSFIPFNPQYFNPDDSSVH